MCRFIIKLIKDNKFDGIIFGGDFLDMSALGECEKGKHSSTGVTLDEEYIEANNMLDRFEEVLPDNCDKVFLYGNHETRYFRWLADVNNKKYGNLLNPTIALKLEERGYKIFEDYANDYFELGSLQVMHGEYYNVHSAKKHLDTFRRNVLYWHTHRMQSHREGDFCAWNAGFLGDIKSNCFNYAKRGMKSKWGEAFAVINVTPKSHYVEIVNCVNNSFVYGGKKY